MQLKPGLRLRSATCSTEVIVIRGGADVDLRCGGALMAAAAGTAAGERLPLDEAFAGATLLGKRYVAFKDPDRIAWELYMA